MDGYYTSLFVPRGIFTEEQLGSYHRSSTPDAVTRKNPATTSAIPSLDIHILLLINY